MIRLLLVIILLFIAVDEDIFKGFDIETFNISKVQYDLITNSTLSHLTACLAREFFGFMYLIYLDHMRVDSAHAPDYSPTYWAKEFG
jgi:hypothetical protein